MQRRISTHPRHRGRCPWLPVLHLVHPQGSEHVQLNLLGNHQRRQCPALAAAAAAACRPGRVVVRYRNRAGCGAAGQGTHRRATGEQRHARDRRHLATTPTRPPSTPKALLIRSRFCRAQGAGAGGYRRAGRDWAEQGHREVGAYAAGKVDALYAVGTNMALIQIFLV